ncbi:hypothetical protein K2173_002689 [Erythroxylum novogranatense]|uniref:Uncharacterized protein n=1 Tax=Erythroxylum novogranatense TaxID=1862640 RepID=A0AAV8SY37_9ROSI|nr:hypothetical protein K2173_002689 [Erythroxylum novogranatense]
MKRQKGTETTHAQLFIYGVQQVVVFLIASLFQSVGNIRPTCWISVAFYLEIGAFDFLYSCVYICPTLLKTRRPKLSNYISTVSDGLSCTVPILQLGVNRDGSHRRLTRVDLYGLDWYSGNVRRKRQLYRCGV